MTPKAFTIRPIVDSDRAWMRNWMRERWGGLVMAIRGQEVHPAELAGFAALDGDQPVGLITYRIEGDRCEITSLDSLKEGIGVGAALLDAVRQTATRTGCRRVTLITTNDNLNALRFYQKRGYCITAVYPNAIKESRRLKPQISRIGLNGIPIRDEIELELILSD